MLLDLLISLKVRLQREGKREYLHPLTHSAGGEDWAVLKSESATWVQWPMHLGYLHTAFLGTLSRNLDQQSSWASKQYSYSMLA